MVIFYLAETEPDYAAAALLFKEYAVTININLDFQHFNEELAGLEKMYAAPFGGIILAKETEVVIGCIAIRKLGDRTGELKRMFIQPGHQQKGIGKILLEKALQLAKECNYTELKLDTLSHMHAAIHLYTQAGFYLTPAYYINPHPNAVYFEKTL